MDHNNSSRIPTVEIEMIEPEVSSDATIDYDDDYEYDHEVEAVSDTEHWIVNAGMDLDND